MTTSSSDSATAASPAAVRDVQSLLGAEHPRRWWRRPAVWVGLLVLLAMGAAGWAWMQQRRDTQAPQYVTEEARRGAITLTVSATGTLQPTRSVTIGSELSGTVRQVLVDVNDRIK
ncbi:MAG TPA: efflux RND transporter periplasmic adaptor subunit, partial [Giesbergeria sp.]|nr:efflux RND transporter periplasmic adaptor subunit [Giesbergeria sp.]